MLKRDWIILPGDVRVAHAYLNAKINLTVENPGIVGLSSVLPFLGKRIGKRVTGQIRIALPDNSGEGERDYVLRTLP